MGGRNRNGDGELTEGWSRAMKPEKHVKSGISSAAGIHLRYSRHRHVNNFHPFPSQYNTTTSLATIQHPDTSRPRNGLGRP
jgi:hypothetical protein